MRKGSENMNFIKGKAGAVLALICLVLILGVIWFCLFDMNYQSQMHGTFVEAGQTDREMGA